MRLPDLYASKRPVFSFEFFPPRTDQGAKNLFKTVTDLAGLSPDYISVTCPLDKPRRELTFDLVARIKREVGVETMAHLVTVDYSRQEMGEVLARLQRDGVENILVLRGDLPEDAPDSVREFEHASDLAAFARPHGFGIGGAAHPEKHPDSPSWESEMQYARSKVDAGVEFLVTQLFFDNADYFRYVERASAVGIDVPIVAGIMPVTSVAGIRRMAKMNGNRIPDELGRALDEVDGDDDAVARVGIEWSTLQCEELVRQGTPGIHFYTLNRSPATREILTELRESLDL
jgi:methylenetetrahydrofolate reductase (NADPH)